MQQTAHSKKIFFAGRGFATIAALLLALIYSQDLGIINRSILTFIMTTNALIWVVLTSGTTLTLRKLGSEGDLRQDISPFFGLILIEAAISLFLYTFIIQLYSQSKNQLADRLFWISLIYVIASGIHLILMEVLVALKRFKIVGYLDISTITLQFILYLSFKFFTNYSIAIILLLSLLLSYFLISFFAFFIIFKTFDGFPAFRNPNNFWKKTRGNHSLGTSLGLMDRSDRFIVGIFLATPVLGAYAVTSSLITLLRFVPDAFAKIVVAKHFDLSRFPKYGKIYIFVAAASLGLVVIVISRTIVALWLGAEWALPILVCIFLGAQELLRGWYQIAANKHVSENHSAKVNRVAITLPFVVFVFCLSLMPLLGLVSVPISFTFGYAGAIWALAKLK